MAQKRIQFRLTLTVDGDEDMSELMAELVARAHDILENEDGEIDGGYTAEMIELGAN